MRKTKSKKQMAKSDDLCAHCTNAAAMIDASGMKWCSDHHFRGDFINEGATLNYPYIQCFPYAIGEGFDCWVLATVSGMDELIWMAIAAIQHMKEVATQ